MLKIIKRDFKFIELFFVLGLLGLIFLKFGEYSLFAVDLPFHILRISGLADSIKHFDFIPNINFNFANGFGYIVPTFYSNLFIYPFAILVALGVSLSKITYVIVFSIIFFGLCISYYSAKSVLSDKNSIVFSILFILSNFLLFSLYQKGSIAEATAYILTPILFFNAIKLLNHKNNWIFFGISLTLIFYAHVLTTIVSIIFLILLFTIYSALDKFKYTKEYILNILKSAIVFALLSFPLYAQIFYGKATNSINLGYAHLNNLSDGGQGASILGYLNLTDFIISSLKMSLYGINMGIFAVLTLILSIIYFKKLSKISKSLFIVAITILFIVFGIMNTGILDGTFLNILQFPMRMFSVLYISLIYVFVEICSKIRFGKVIKKISVAISILYLLLFTFVNNFVIIKAFSGDNINNSMESNIVQKASYIDNYKEYTWDVGGGQEYLPIYFTLDYENNIYEKLIELSDVNKVISGDATITNVKDNYNDLSFTIDSKSDSDIEVNRIYYNDYRIYLNDKDITDKYEKDGKLIIRIPSGSVGKINIKYNKNIIYYLSNVVGVASVIGLVIFIKKRNKKDLD